MAFPTNLDSTSTIPVEASGTALSVNHVTNHTASQTAILAIEAKVGVDSSAVTTSHDYKLSGVTGSDKALKSGTSTQSVTGLTLVTPKITVGSDAVGDLHYTSNVDGTQSRLAVGADNYILKINGSAIGWEAETSTVDASSTVKGLVEIATAAEITAGTATGGTSAVLAISPDQLALSTPVFNGSSLTGLNKVMTSTIFDNSGRFTSTTTGVTGNTNTFTVDGLLIARASTYGATYNNVTFAVNGKASTLYLGNPVFTTRVNLTSTANSVFSTFFGLGNPTAAATGHTYTVGHTGFKIVKTGGVISLYATQANGSTETASSALTTLASGDDVDLILQINSTTSVDYWYRVNGGTLSSATNLSTNMPSGTSKTIQHSLSSDNVDDGIVQLTVSSASYAR